MINGVITLPSFFICVLTALALGLLTALVFTAYQRIDREGRPLSRVDVPPRLTYAEALKGNAICCSTVI